MSNVSHDTVHMPTFERVTNSSKDPKTTKTHELS